jgi:hypothetical protein
MSDSNQSEKGTEVFMKKPFNFGLILLAAVLAAGFVLGSCSDIVDVPTADDGARAETISNKDAQGKHDGYDYEMWRDNGTVEMTLNNGGNFSCKWSNIGNALFRKGKKFDSTKTHDQIGNISINYSASFTPGGNSYLCVYGWSKDPLVEYYIIESYGTYKPTGTAKGSLSVDGGTYELYETTRTNQPSIVGNTTFKQFWSVRTSKRTSGTISVSEHFKAWDKAGMKLGKMYEVALLVEGYQSKGDANVTSHTLTIGGSSNNNTNNNTTNNNTSSGSGTNSTTTASGATKVEAENMTKGGKYTGSVSSPFNGVILYANDDKVSFSQNFANNSHTFKVRGASSNSNEAQVQLKIGGTSYGTFKFKGTSATEQSITASHNQGGKTATVELICVNDNDTWDSLIDWIEISSSSGGSTNTGNTNNNTTNNNTTNNNTANNNSGGTTSSGGATKIEAEKMTKGGKYTGYTSSPFTGVILYANDDKVSTSIDFSNNKHAFKVRGVSSNEKTAKVELRVGGTKAGTLEFTGTTVAEKTIEFQHNQGGKKATVELVCVGDDNTWDVKLDWIEITAK